MLMPTTDRGTGRNWKGYFNIDILIAVISIYDQGSRYLEMGCYNNGTSMAHISWHEMQRKPQSHDHLCGICLQNTDLTAEIP